MAKLLKDGEVRALLTMQSAIAAVEDTFRDVALGEAVNVARQRGALKGVIINAAGGISTALDIMGMKVTPMVRKDITVGSSFTMLVYRISTGAMIGVLEVESLSQIRTGAASAVAAKYLARADSRIMTLFGAGWQAQAQLEALAVVLPGLERVNVISRSPERAAQFCTDMAPGFGFELIASPDPQQAVSEADVVTTATGSRTPVFDGRWLRPGVHVNAIGSNFAGKQELDATTIRRTDYIVVDDLEGARVECGDLLEPEASAAFDWSDVRALSDVVAGQARGRSSAQEITLFESQGLGLEDVAVASVVLKLADARGVGTEIPLQ